MAKVMQQRSLPSEVGQPFLAQAYRVDDMQATQSADQVATFNGIPLGSSYIEPTAADQTPLPTFDLSPMLGFTQDTLPQQQIQQLCQAVANCLRETGCLVVQDPRVKAKDNMAFLDMMERYFAQSTATKLQDTRPELHFQVSQATS